MANYLQDLWDSCYSSEHRKVIPPEEFKKTFCDQCMNTTCQNSKGSGTSWAKRILTQEDKLLRNPVFAELNDPRFKRFSELDFQSVLQEVLSIEISEARGDWSIPTKEEVGREAASLLGLAPPVSWMPPIQEEPEDPQPPAKLVDEVSHTDLEGKPTLQEKKTNLSEIKPGGGLEGSWKIIGDSGSVWEVSVYSGDKWTCGCPVYQHRKIECKHILDIQRKLQRSPLQSPPETRREPPKEPSPLPAALLPPPGIAPIFKPAGGSNTRLPEGGLMIGGGHPPVAREEDPWGLPPTAPPLNERVIPVGGRVQFKK